MLRLALVAAAAATVGWLLGRQEARPGPPTFAGDDEDIVEGLEGLIGGTKLVRLQSLCDATGCDILAKAEYLNPGGSPKDRVAQGIIHDAEQRGLLRPGRGDKVYEGTVGSTGIALAGLCLAKGYRAHICMPNDVAREKSMLLRALGAEVEQVPPASIVDKAQFVNWARTQAHEHSRDPQQRGCGFFADQFENRANFRAHYDTTGPEIWHQCGHRLDAFITGAGTGGTLAGVAMYLKQQNPRIRVVLADPQGSGLYNRVTYGVMYDAREKEGTRTRHQVDSLVEGIGITRITANFEAAYPLVDSAYRVTDAEAVAMGRYLVEKEGLFLGSSSAVNCAAAVKLARDMGPGNRIVTILCDSGQRHLSKMYDSEYVASRGLHIPDTSNLDFLT